MFEGNKNITVEPLCMDAYTICYKAKTCSLSNYHYVGLVSKDDGKTTWYASCGWSDEGDKTIIQTGFKTKKAAVRWALEWYQSHIQNFIDEDIRVYGKVK